MDADDDIAALIREERLSAAGELASSRGMHHLASTLFEQACLWGKASEAALTSGNPKRAMLLAVRSGETASCERAAQEVERTGRSAEVAEALQSLGALRWAARLFESAGRRKDAARLWERAGDDTRAASLLRADGDIIGAARVLEAGLRRAPERSELALELGRLLMGYGKVEAAVRALQKVPDDAPERRSAVSLLVRALAKLGFDQARAEAEAELLALGGATADAPSESEQSFETRLFGRYVLVHEVASSPSARVLECEDRVRHVKVALKIFAGHHAHGAGRDALARFEREVIALRSLDHPNIVPMLDYIPEGPAIACVWMSGGTLADALHQRVMTPARAVGIARDLLQALGAAHRIGIVHRDVKPSNVLFDHEGHLFLADFGAAHLGDLSATATAGVIGTLAYMSPEQRAGQPATSASDLYAVGRILFEMLTGTLPPVDRPVHVLPSHAHPSLDARHDAAIMRLFADAPEERPSGTASAQELLLALDWPDVLEPAGEHTTVPPSLRPWKATERTRRDEGSDHDTWLERYIERVPLDETSLARARSFARASHGSLQLVLRVAREDGTLWLEAARGARPKGALSAGQQEDLEAALAALHRAGHVHGAVDENHVTIDPDGRAVLSFSPHAAPTASIEQDRRALRRLFEHRARQESD